MNAARNKTIFCRATIQDQDNSSNANIPYRCKNQNYDQKKKKGWINAGSYPASIARFPDEFGKYYLLKIIGPERLV